MASELIDDMAFVFGLEMGRLYPHLCPRIVAALQTTEPEIEELIWAGFAPEDVGRVAEVAALCGMAREGGFHEA
jgi:hypothetical protein